MTGALKNIDFNKANISYIQDSLLLTRERLLLECESKDSVYNEEAKFQFKRIIDTIDKKKILNMPINNIEKYIKDLIAIIDFNTGEF